MVDGERHDGPRKSPVAGADALLVRFDTVDTEAMDATPDCRIISRTGIGLDNVDVDAATERGIPPDQRP